MEQSDIHQAALPAYRYRSETEWIRLHLSIVEQTLSARNTDNLTASQKRNRHAALNHLHTYWIAGAFPQNEDYVCRTPVFIDKYDNFCAVGYLIKATGYEHISRMIAAKTNLAYVREMNYPELNAWAKEYGFTIDELAWIQPGYIPNRFTAPMGKGTDGTVHELFVDKTGEKLFVGGKFEKVDGTITANNIAYITQIPGSITWHAMGTGVNGPVYAVAEYKDKIFVAGSFTEAGGVPATNVAYWDGNSWHDAGCTYGEIRDLVVFDNELYACGKFDICAALSEVNFARWDSTRWQQYGMLPGIVNSMEVLDTMLLLGGHFLYQNDTVNVIMWNKNTYFRPFNNRIRHEVRDFQMYKGTLYAACKQSVLNDTNLVYTLSNDTWTAQPKLYNYYPLWKPDTVSVNTLCVEGDTLTAGGHFFANVGMTGIGNAVTLMGGSSNWIWTDSSINKMIVYKGQLIAGGSFRSGGHGTKVNSIARKVYEHPAVKVKELPGSSGVMHLYPNPASSSSTINVENNFNATHFRMNSAEGKVIKEQQINSSRQTIELNNVAPGIYNSEISNDKGEKATEQVIVK